MIRKFMLATAASALVAALPAAAQMWEGYDNSAGYGDFETGFTQTGTYDAWDWDDDGVLDENEFGQGVYSAWDTDDSVGIDESEFTTGVENWYGPDHDADFATWDADGSGVVETDEFRENWNPDMMADWDGNADGMLDQVEYTSGVFDSADLDDDQYITVEEEGWFEGWFDGDDVEAEIREVGEAW